MSLKYAVLAVLAHQDRTGYELTCKIDGSVANFWPATHQQIYLELKKLLKDGLVHCREKKQRKKPDKKIYSLSETGLIALKAWIAAPIEPTPVKDVILVKLFAGHRVDKQILCEELLRHEKKHKAKLLEYIAIENQYFPHKKIQNDLLYQYLTLQKGILYEKYCLKWLKQTIKKLAK